MDIFSGSIIGNLFLKKIFKLYYKTNDYSAKEASIQSKIKKSGIKRKKTRTEIFLLVFFNFFAGICVMFAVDNVVQFINPEIKKLMILFIGIVIICGVIASIIISIVRVLFYS